MPTVLENIDSSGKKYFVEINTGEAENGVPVGGSTGQVLAKASNANYDSEWVTPDTGGSVDSVNGMTGVVVLDTDDIGEGITNKYLSATQKTDLTDGGTTTLHTHSHTALTDIGTNTHAQIDTKLASLLNEREITKESTGFTNNENITVTYNETTRKVTLTGTFVAYYKGEVVSILVNGWESPAHADVAGTYFLHYCDGGLLFDTSPWTFDCLQIAFVQYGTYKLGLRETHGFMQWQSHKEFHETIGTYKTGGGTFSSYTLNSTTATDRRPDISNVTVRDEDLTSTILALTTKQYTNRYLTGAGVRTFSVLQPEIIPVNGNIPYYNQFNGTNWVQTPMTNNTYGAIFVVGVPTTDDAISQRYRFMFVQPQQVGALADIQALTPNDLTHGDSSLLVSEFVFFAKIIIQVSGNNWSITSIEDITGTRLNQTSSPSGNYLSIVAHDTTLTGDGTSLNPLSVVEQQPMVFRVTTLAQFKTALEDTTYPVKTILVNDILGISENTSIAVSGINYVHNDFTVLGAFNITLTTGGTVKFMNNFTVEGAQFTNTLTTLYINRLAQGSYVMFLGTGARYYQFSIDKDQHEGIGQSNWISEKQDLSTYALKSNVLELNNTVAFTPDQDYEPATKKYVDGRTTGKVINTLYEATSMSDFKIACEDTTQTHKNIILNGALYLSGDVTINLYGNINVITPVNVYGNSHTIYFDGTDYRTEFSSNPTLDFLYLVDFVGTVDIDLTYSCLQINSIGLASVYTLTITKDNISSYLRYQYRTGTGTLVGATQSEWLGLPEIVDVLTSTSTTAALSAKQGNNLASGWTPAPGTYTFGSADSPTFITNAVGLTDVICKGDKFGLTQSQALSGYWSFDTNSSADVGTFTMGNIGTPTYTAGKFGNALTLNGTNQALSITDTALLKPTGAFTIGAWIKTSNTGAIKLIYQSYSDNTNANGNLLFVNLNNVLSFATGNNSADNISISGNTVVTDGNFHYVVATFNNNYAQIYLDGALEASGYLPAPTYAATNYVRIGCYNVSGSNSFWFNGQIDDLFLINGYALDEKTIRDKYTANTAQGTSAFDVDKIFLVHANPTSSTLTLYGGTDFQLSNSAISNVYYSKVKNPQGYNGNDYKWSLFVRDSGGTRSQSSPTNNVWYNLGGVYLPIHIGDWETYYSAYMVATKASAGIAVFSTLSTANNTQSNSDFTIVSYDSASSITANTHILSKTSISRNSKQNYYLNSMSDSTLTTIQNNNGQSPAIIKATSIYC